MMMRPLLYLCIPLLLVSQPGFAQEQSQEKPQEQSQEKPQEQSLIPTMPAPQIDPGTSWLKIQDFDEMSYMTVQGPPLPENAARAKEETQLYEDMVDNFDDLEDEDDDYLFVIEALFDPEDSSRPASLRSDEDADNVPDNGQSYENLSSSIYIDTVRPTFFPGFQIKPRPADIDKKDNADARSLFADLDKPKADDILKDDVKPIVPGEAPKVPEAVSKEKTTADAVEKAGEKAGKINAPPKQHIVSPDEETLGALKKAVKDLGLEKRLNLGKGVGGHQSMESNDAADPKPDAASAPKKPAVAAKPKVNAKKKLRKPRRQPRPSAEEPAAPAPPPKDESIFDDLF